MHKCIGANISAKVAISAARRCESVDLRADCATRGGGRRTRARDSTQRGAVGRYKPNATARQIKRLRRVESAVSIPRQWRSRCARARVPGARANRQSLVPSAPCYVAPVAAAAAAANITTY